MSYKSKLYIQRYNIYLYVFNNLKNTHLKREDSHKISAFKDTGKKKGPHIQVTHILTYRFTYPHYSVKLQSAELQSTNDQRDSCEDGVTLISL